MSAASLTNKVDYTSMFSTRLFMPGWWVRAFDSLTAFPQESTINAIDIAWKMQILPALDLSELNALAAVTSELQEQLLLQGDTDLRIDPSHFEKHASTSNRNRVHAFAKVLQLLPAIRLLRDQDSRVEAVPLFASERWLKESENLILDVRLHELGAELLLGYTCSHLELMRKANNKPLVQDLLGPHAPLGFWRSAWMELQGTEQAFLIRLEKAMQWENCWLHFDGIFGKSLAELMRGLDLRLPKRQLELRPTKLAKLQWLLDKVGRKLVHQGLIRLDVDDDYLAVSENHDRGTLLVWQVTAQKAFTDDVERYRSDCLDFLQRYRVTPRIEQIVKVLDPSERFYELAQIGRRLMDESENQLLEPLAHIASATPVLAVPTFLEWRTRQMEGHPLPLPSELAESDAAKLCLSDEDGIVEACVKFSSMIRNSLDLRDSFQLVPEATISQSTAWNLRAVKDYLKDINEDRPYTPAKATRPEKKLTEVKADRSAQINDQKIGPLKQSVNMRRLANEELSKLRQHEPNRYRELKQTYINSLDEPRRKLILDLQGRVSPEHFDNHLRGSLVRYMIENPSVWKSAKPPAKPAASRH